LKSLRAKYIIALTLILTIVFGGISVKSFRASERRIKKNQTARLTMVTNIVKNALTAVMLEGRAQDFQRFVETIIEDDINAIRLFSEDGTIIASSNRADRGRKINISQEEFAQPKLSSFEDSGHLIYSMRVPIFNEKPCQRCHGTARNLMGALDVEVIMDDLNESLRDVWESSAIIFGISLVALFASVSLLTRFLVVKPILEIIETVKRVEEGDLKARFNSDRTDEIGNLARSLNSMLSELNRARQEVESCHIEAMRKVEKMATIGELASAIAHEIKNPLAGISGAIQVFAEDFPETDPRRSIINEVLSEIERLDKAVRDLLNFARPPEPHFIKTTVVPVLERALRLITPQAKKQGVEINMVIVSDPPEVYIDPEQMQQVFLNLIINALHSMPGGGSITITTHNRPEDKEFDIIISDTGYGISQADLKNIFKPFFTTKHMGTGLGLAISKNIVEKHGGDITVESQIGVGSSFKITLPLGAPIA